MFETRTDQNASSSVENKVRIQKYNSRYRIVTKILELYFQIYIIYDIDIKQSDSLIKETKSEIRIEIKRVS